MKKHMPDKSSDLEAHALGIIKHHLSLRPKTRKMWTRLTDSSDVQACWKMANYVAGTKLGMNDHGRTHAYVATASALTMLDLLDGSLFCPDIVTGGFGDQDDATLVVMTAMLCHDLGNTIHREEHANLGVSVTLPILTGSCQKFMMTRQSSSQSGHSFSQPYTHITEYPVRSP